MIDWTDLIERRNKWVAHNFPYQVGAGPEQSIMGVMEEAGELAHAHLKTLQNIRGSATEHDAAAQDAIGDCTIYLLGAMQAWGVAPNPDYRVHAAIRHGAESVDELLFQLGRRVGSLCSEAVIGLANTTPIREQLVGLIVTTLEAYSYEQGWDYEMIVMDTWEQVEKRDWIAYPNTGFPQTVEAVSSPFPQDEEYRGPGDNYGYETKIPPA